MKGNWEDVGAWAETCTQCTVLLLFILQSEGISKTGEMWQQALLCGASNCLCIHLFKSINPFISKWEQHFLSLSAHL